MSTIRNHITLKLTTLTTTKFDSLSTIRNHITLKRDENLQKSVKGLSTIRNHITLKPQIQRLSTNETIITIA